MTYKTVKDYFERKPNASYLFFACMIFLFRVFLNWYGNDAQLVTLLDVIWTLMMTAGFVAGDRSLPHSYLSLQKPYSICLEVLKQPTFLPKMSLQKKTLLSVPEAYVRIRRQPTFLL